MTYEQAFTISRGFSGLQARWPLTSSTMSSCAVAGRAMLISSQGAALGNEARQKSVTDPQGQAIMGLFLVFFPPNLSRAFGTVNASGPSGFIEAPLQLLHNEALHFG